MGVLPFPRKVKIQTGDSNSEASSAPNTDDESGRATPATIQVAQAPRPAPKGLPALVAHKIGQSLQYKKGRRSKHRFDNERLLIAIYGIEEEDFEPGRHSEHKDYFTDILEQHQLVDDFLNQEEGKYSTIQEEQDEEIEEVSEENVQAEEAFMRIGWRLRQVLKKKVTMTILENIEDSINQNFVQDPESPYVSELANGYERLLVHCLSGYYSLNSHSYDMNGKRLIKVENPRKTFNPKDPGLAEYLQLRRKLHSNQSHADSRSG